MKVDFKHLSAEEWDYYNARKNEAKYDPSDPKQNKVKHVYVHNDNKGNNSEVLQCRINNAIAKLMEIDISESERKQLVQILTGHVG